MEAQEKSEWRKDFLGGGKHLGVSQSETARVEINQGGTFQGEGRGIKCSGINLRKRKGSFFQRQEEMNTGKGDNRYFEEDESDLWSESRNIEWYGEKWHLRGGAAPWR